MHICGSPCGKASTLAPLPQNSFDHYQDTRKYKNQVLFVLSLHGTFYRIKWPLSIIRRGSLLPYFQVFCSDSRKFQGSGISIGALPYGLLYTWEPMDWLSFQGRLVNLGMECVLLIKVGTFRLAL